MKVLFCIHRFFPDEIGGTYIVTDLLCRELLLAGWQVEVATPTPPSAAGDSFPYPVRRGWSMGALRRRMREVDCVVMQHLSIRHLLPLWFSGARRLTVLHTGLDNWSGKQALYTLLFRWHVRLSRHTAAVSDALRRSVPGVRDTIPNPYDNTIFSVPADVPPVPRTKLAFVGRVVSVKGVEFAIEALGMLRRRGHDCDLTIIGDGESLPAMRSLVRKLALEPWVTFAGQKDPAQVAVLLRELGTLLVPSNYFEAFGLVALEGIACGMDVVAFRRGGLPEAVGEAGLICDENTAAGLAAKVEDLLNDPALRARLHAAREAHLARFRKENSAAHYREVISAIVAARRRSALAL